MADIVVEPLTPDQIGPAYTLVFHTDPAIDFAAWKRLVRPMLRLAPSARQGVMIARRTGQRFPCGLVWYRRERDLGHGPVLWAEHFIAMDLLDPTPVVAALVKELEDLAQRLGCKVVRSVAHRRSTTVCAGLLAAGHQQGGVLFQKTVED
jgi:hypothetical protein